MTGLPLRRLLEVVGSPAVVPLAAPAGLDVPVTGVVIHDASGPRARADAGDLVLAVGGRLGQPGVDRLLVDAAAAGAAAVVVRADRDEGLAGPGVAVLGVHPDLDWTHLFTLTRGLVGTAAGRATGSAGELFGFADAVADMVGGSVVLYDRDHRVLAHSSQDDDVDDVRRGTILGRRTPPQWVRRFEQDGVYAPAAAGTGVRRLDGYAGLRTRLRVAVHASDQVLGEISVAETGTPLEDGAERALAWAARAAAPYFLRHLLAHDGARTARGEALRALLDGGGAVETSARELDLDASTACTVLGFTLRPAASPGTDGHERERLARLVALLTEAFRPSAGTTVVGGTTYALVPARRAVTVPTDTERRSLLRLAEQVGLRAQALELHVHGAVGPSVSGLAEAPRSRRDVDQVLRVLAGRGAPGVALAETLWADVALLDLRDSFADQGRPPSEHLSRLATHDRAHRTQYVRTLRTYLDAFGDVRGAAASLALHPNSLRHRLQRIRQLFDVDLDDPAQRLLLSLELHTVAEGFVPPS